jgi:ABC transporter fused permease/ATP-binding protein
MSDEQSASSPPVSWRRLAELARPQAAVLTWATLALLISSGMSLVYPQAIQRLVDTIVQRGDLSALNQASAFLVGTFFVQAIFAMGRSWLFTLAGERVVTDLRKDLYRAIIGQDIAFFDTSRTGELTSRLSSDTAVLQNTVTVNVSMLLRYIFGSVGGVVLLVYTSPTLAAVAMAVVPFVAIGASFYGRWVRKLSKEVQDALAQSSEVAEETFSGVRTVRAFARESWEVERYTRSVEESYSLAAKRAFAFGLFQGGIGLAGYLAIALVLWVGGRLVLSGGMTLGELTAFLAYTMLVAVSLGALSGLWGDFMRAFGSSARVFELLDRAAPLEGAHGKPVAGVEGRIHFDHVRFAYPSRPDVIVLDDFDLDVAPGQLVALVGPSGAGKSTVAGLVMRFYDAVAGRVLVDGTDLREVDPRSLREHIGVVSQEPILFATSIADNIRYGRPGASDEEVEAAARAANAHEFVTAFPDGYRTQVGERGVRLSGGQKQRIAIARAILKDPKILVLDEATSALDAQNEHLVQEALDRLMKGRTTIVIAHRLSTVQGADRIVVLDGGRVVEQGRHAELVAKRGLYHQLVQRQFDAAA